MEKSKILIVDDEPTVLDVLHRALLKQGYVCDTASDGDKALEYLKENSYDLIITDLNMPKMDGLELITRIKRQDPDKAIIVISANSDIALLRQCIIEHGAYDYIVKPFTFADVFQTVKRAIERSQLIKQIKDYQANLEQKIEIQAEKIKQIFINAITSLVRALEAKDRYTQGHSQRVTLISLAMGRLLSLSQTELEEIKLSAQLHDIGKIGVKESILNKPDKLTPEEYEQVKQHSLLGEKILKPVIENPVILLNVRHHHERYDGTGYPDQLNNSQIHLQTRILSLADAWDAMRSDRPYRKKLSFAEARQEVERAAGTQLDVMLVELFLKNFISEESIYNAARTAGAETIHS